MPKSAEWEVIDQPGGGQYTSRLRVEGGWLYKQTYGLGQTMVFVPAIPRLITAPFKKPEPGTIEPWPEKAERLLAAAQAVCNESYEDGNEDGDLGLSERVDCVPKEVMDDLKAIVTEISDEVVALIRKVQADAADES